MFKSLERQTEHIKLGVSIVQRVFVMYMIYSALNLAPILDFSSDPFEGRTKSLPLLHQFITHLTILRITQRAHNAALCFLPY